MSEKIVRVIDLVPGSTQPVAEMPAADLSAAQFWTDYVCRHQPLVIRGGAAAWPALQRWQRPGYLEALCGDETVGFARSFNPVPTETYFNTLVKPRRLDECLAEMRSAPDSATCAIPSTRVPPAWESDLGDYAFLSSRFERRPRGYPGKRMFVYKNASTDWHYHHTDETITTQLAGRKRVSLFRLTAAEWDTYALPIKANFHHMDGGRKFFPEESALSKYEAVLEEGDSIYLPPFWWHGIDPADAEFGITLAHCFQTPLRRLADWSEPITQELVQSVRPSKLTLLQVMALVAASSLSRKAAGETWWPAVSAR